MLKSKIYLGIIIGIAQFFLGYYLFPSNIKYPYESTHDPRLGERYPYNSDYSGRIQDLYQRASVFIKNNHFKEAIELFKDVIKKHPGTPEVWNNLGYLYEKIGETVNAEFSYKKAIQYNSNYSDALNNLGFLYLKENREIDTAFRMISRALELNPKSKYYHDSMGYYWMKLKDFKKARNQFLIALHYDKNFPSPHFHLALLSEMEKNLPEMIKELEFALKLAPDWVFLHYYLYDAYLNSGEFSQADVHKTALEQGIFQKNLPEDIIKKFRERNFSNLQMSILMGISEVSRVVYKETEFVGDVFQGIDQSPFFSEDLKKLMDQSVTESFSWDDSGNIVGKIHGLNGYLFEKKAGYTNMENNYTSKLSEINGLIGKLMEYQKKIEEVKGKSGK